MKSLVRILLEAEFSSWQYGASLHRAFHYHSSIVSIWLKYYGKGTKAPNHHHHNHNASKEFFSHIWKVKAHSLMFTDAVCKRMSLSIYSMISSDSVSRKKHLWLDPENVQVNMDLCCLHIALFLCLGKPAELPHCFSEAILKLIHNICFGWNVVYFKFIITKTCLYNFDPLQPHFYIVQGSLKDSYSPCRRMTMERPQNSRLKLVAFNCDLDLESALLSYGLCKSSH